LVQNKAGQRPQPRGTLGSVCRQSGWPRFTGSTP
jgi:hypothetical protein